MKKKMIQLLCVFIGVGCFNAQVFADETPWNDRITISGYLEAQASYESMNFDNPNIANENASDVLLSTIELGLEAEIAKNISGQLLLLWEEDESDGIDVDEGFITIEAGENLPVYFSFGKMYVPFGNYETHMISDPITLELGETSESALKFGFNNDTFNLSLSLYNGYVNKTEDKDDHLSGIVGNVSLNLPKDIIPNLGLTAGISFMSNMADTCGIEVFLEDTQGADADNPPVVNETILGLNVFISASLMDKLFFEAAYTGALDDLLPENTKLTDKIKPKAWNIECAIAPMDVLKLAIRYEGSEEFIDHPEKQMGGAMSYFFNDNASVNFEVLWGEFENKDQRTLLTALVGVEF
ncbi:conserved hypothetical protein, secreted [Candidatus Magnetomorum sp. HK-1]|nr:conserved hypothetical protein, secreted [Candidatus Magnetomorum sp. HK-1]